MRPGRYFSHSIDKSCKTWEGGNTVDGPQPGQITWGYGGAHTHS